MDKFERKDELVRLLYLKQKMKIKELERAFPVSRATVHRDLAELAQEGRVIREYGSVSYCNRSQDVLFGGHPKEIHHLDNKIRIGKAAQELISDQDVVFVTHGTTTRQLFNNLPQSRQFTVITDGIDILCSCANYPLLRTFIVGGLVNFETNQMEYVPNITAAFESINIQKLVMGVAAISLTKGVTFYDYASYQLLKHVVNCVDEIIIMADSTKFGHAQLLNCIPIEKNHSCYR